MPRNVCNLEKYQWENEFESNNNVDKTYWNFNHGEWLVSKSNNEVFFFLVMHFLEFVWKS